MATAATFSLRFALVVGVSATACTGLEPSPADAGDASSGAADDDGSEQMDDDDADDDGGMEGDDGTPETGGADDGDPQTDTGDVGDDGSTDDGDDGSTDGGGNTDPIPSAGCGNAAMSPGEHAGVAVEFSGSSRSFDLVVPPAHDGSTPLPLVLNFHGWTQTPADHAEFSQMNGTAIDRGFVLAYPAGIDNSWNAGICCGGAQSQGLDDVGFARAVVAQIGTATCIDERRVYAVGHSNGGFLAHRLACEAADVFAAIGSVAGVIGIDAAQCTPGRAVPVMHLHGTGDTIVSIDGGGVLGHPSAQSSTVGWVARNGCDATAATALDQGDTTCQRWTGCGDGGEVQMCTIEAMGHCWPGNPTCTLGPPSTTVHASDMLADFFTAHVMP
ncbi:MAG: PHB depolymerase family esterase [Myxococcota bacterium]